MKATRPVTSGQKAAAPKIYLPRIIGERMHPSRIKSIGIDIGTTTTHLVVSELEFANVSRGAEVPKLAVVNRTILYQSPIYFTPLNAAGVIDAEGVAMLLQRELEGAKVSANEIDTGAVIVTGETAKKRNAAQLARELANQSGNFVVAVAGAKLESLLSGKGAGAALYSRENSKTVCNIDIGGGTTNFSVFENGNCIECASLGIGGRFIQLDESFLVKSLTDSAEDFLDGVAKLKLVSVNKVLERETAQLFCNLLSEVILHACTRKKTPQIVQRLLQTEPLKLNYEIDEFWFSGGVAECMSAPKKEDIPFGDMGNLLARALLLALAEREMNYRISPGGIRATVIGAGSHSLQVAGHTVTVSCADQLPLKDVRILRPFDSLTADSDENTIRQRLASALQRSEGNEDQGRIAVVINDLSNTSYEILNRWAMVFSEAYEASKIQPLIILSERDVALALGQAIRRRNQELQVLVLDSVDLSYGDYIDIGNPLAGGSSIPLTIKTLIFNE